MEWYILIIRKSSRWDCGMAKNTLAHNSRLNKNDIVFCTDILGTLNEVRNRDTDTRILTNFATADTKI